jgi:hypothetical protein
MMDSLYGNGLLLLGLWVSTSLVMLFIWGVLAWAVVNTLSRQRFGRRWAGATEYRNSHHLHQTVGYDSGRRARSNPENRSVLPPRSRADSRGGRLRQDRRRPLVRRQKAQPHSRFSPCERPTRI